MGIIGFSTIKEQNKNLATIFLSPIIFYITASILKDHFNSKNQELIKEREARNKEADRLAN